MFVVAWMKSKKRGGGSKKQKLNAFIHRWKKKSKTVILRQCLKLPNLVNFIHLQMLKTPSFVCRKFPIYPTIQQGKRRIMWMVWQLWCSVDMQFLTLSISAASSFKLLALCLNDAVAVRRGGRVEGAWIFPNRWYPSAFNHKSKCVINSSASYLQ